MSVLNQNTPNFCLKTFFSGPLQRTFLVCYFENQNRKCVIPNEFHNAAITGVVFNNCNPIIFPKDVFEIFPNIRVLKIKNSAFSSFTRADLWIFRNILEIHVTGCKNLQELSSEVFDDLLNLEVIVLENNNLINVGPNILNKLKYLKYVNFNGNPGISGIYDSIKRNGNFLTLKELKSDLLIRYQNLYILHLQQRKQILHQKNNVEKIETIEDDQVSTDVMKNIYNKKFQDFSVFIGDYEILVHRIVLASRCPKFARMLNDENVRHFSLFNITTTVFGRILDYLYYDKMPVKTEGENWKYVEIFEAAVEYELEKLKEFAEMKIIKLELNVENAIKILELSNKHDNEDLRNAAFNEIQKSFKGRELNKEFAKDSGWLTKIIETVDENEQMLKEALEELDKFL
ncbi:hypothetical protein PVAND_017467 [Polypedilum vanderplanki]|uniref:BTB domain-containing protein n=1 Tax=Polypedilum vanderplanki TaxID=319348 RepID=A0A9J6BID7_POLVA|nr:hypothetical protein PVAND_017467 [Polypedilum vanderplanki]